MSFVYDDNGNMTQKTEGAEVTNFIHNEEDRLVRVEDDSSTVIAEYYYDPFGRRLWKDVGGTKTYFFYADEGLVGEYDGAGAEIKTYGYKPGSTWTTDPLFMKIGGDYYFYQNDHLGTPQKITGINGSVVWTGKYGSFGEVTVEVETVENNLRFPGQYYDQETGLHYNWHRYYESTTGRYLTEDPVRFIGKEVHCSPQMGIKFDCNKLKLIKDEMEIEHLYSYVECNPINYMDTNGLGKRSPKDFKDLYDKYKDAKGVYDACKPIWNKKGGFKEDCSLVECQDCAKEICAAYWGTGTGYYKFCLDSMFGVCLSVCPCP